MNGPLAALCLAALLLSLSLAVPSLADCHKTTPPSCHKTTKPPTCKPHTSTTPPSCPGACIPSSNKQCDGGLIFLDQLLCDLPLGNTLCQVVCLLLSSGNGACLTCSQAAQGRSASTLTTPIGGGTEARLCHCFC